jgi:hypothetical protein
MAISTWELQSQTSQGDIILAVSTAGSDTSSVNRPPKITKGDFSTYPFLTIQAAINALPKRITNNYGVRISVGPGSFAGFVVEGFTCGSRLTFGGYPGPFGIQGSRATASPATGPATGTATSASSTWLTMTGAGWTTDDLMGRAIRITAGSGAGVIGLIATNTSDTIRFAGQIGATLDGTSQFVIEDLTTIINSVATGKTAAVTVTGCVGDTIRLYDLKTTNTTGLYGFRLSYSNGVTCTRCLASGAVNYGFLAADISGFISLTSCCAFNATYHGYDLEVCGYINGGQSAISARNCPTGIFIYDIGAEYIINPGGYVKDCTVAYDIQRSIATVGGGLRIDSCATGIMLDNSTLVLTPGIHDFSNGGTFLTMKNGSRCYCERNVTGTGNSGWGFNLSGSNNIVQLSVATPTVTGTLGDVTLDGVNDETWAYLGTVGNTVVNAATGARITRV